MESKDLLIRCSSLGSIMTNSRTKSVPLSKTAQSHIIERFNEIEFGISNFWTNNYVKKGNTVEDESLMVATRVNDWDFLVKNEERFQNDFVTGIPDAIAEDYVVEIKSSWQLHTHPMHSETNPNGAYDWQLQGYLWLTGKPVGYISYVLVNTPEEIVLDELFRTARKNGYIDLPPEVENEIRHNHSFGHIPEHLRVKTYMVERDEELISKISERIELCREFYESLKTKLQVS